MLSILRNIQRISSITPKLFSATPSNSFVAMYHILSRHQVPAIIENGSSNFKENKLLLNSSILPNLLQQPSCGLKVKGVLRRRCKDCYFVKRQERLYVMCKTSPRHKQMSFVKKEKNTWMLSHAMQSKVRPY